MLDERVRYYHPINFSRINLNSSVEDVGNSLQLAWNLGIHHALLLKVCKWIIRNFVVIAVIETSDIARNDYQLLSRKINLKRNGWGWCCTHVRSSSCECGLVKRFTSGTLSLLICMKLGTRSNSFELRSVNRSPSMITLLVCRHVVEKVMSTWWRRAYYQLGEFYKGSDSSVGI